MKNFIKMNLVQNCAAVFCRQAHHSIKMSVEICISADI